MLSVLDLFSGVGGFSLGLERTLGFKTVAFCEIDPFCRRVLARHWPGVPCYDDVRTLTAERLGADGIAVDVICGGFPCQDISLAGAGAGLAGERSGLWSEFARLIGEIRPRYAIIENVSALISGRDEINVPADRCLCGWPYRRRGMPLDTKQIGSLVRAAMRRWDVGEGASGSPETTPAVWWQSRVASEGDGEVGSCLEVVGQRQGMPGLSDRDCAASRAETRASAPSAADGQYDGTDQSGSGDGVEPEGADDDAGGGLVCEGCGRPVAHAATRPVVSTWMGRVLGDLAALGFDAEWHCIPASAVGAPHRRDRVWIIAHTNGVRAELRERDFGAADERQWEVLGGRCPYVADAVRELQGHGHDGTPARPGLRAEGHEGAWGALRHSDHWDVEPGVGRVAHGVPARVDRLRALGNAVVPQVVTALGRAILAAETAA